MNGLGLDDWLQPVIDSAKPRDVPVVRARREPAGRRLRVPARAARPTNPHLWLDVRYAEKYVGRIADALAAADPSNGRERSRPAATPTPPGSLRSTPRSASRSRRSPRRTGSSSRSTRRSRTSPRPTAWTIVGSVVQVPGQDPSAGEVAALVRRDQAVGGEGRVLPKPGFNPDLSKAIADEAGVKVETNLYNDSLGDPPVDTYEGLIRWDVERIVAALGRPGYDRDDDIRSALASARPPRRAAAGDRRRRPRQRPRPGPLRTSGCPTSPPATATGSRSRT